MSESPRPQRSAAQQVPVGLEKVLLLASTDTRFRDQLLRDRDAAASARGLALRASERAVLRSIPEERLLAAIEGIDASPANLRRRRFMGAVAASAAAVVAAEAFGGCDSGAVDGIRPDRDYGPQPDRSVDAGVPDAGAPDGGVPDAAPTVDISELGTGLDAMASKGIRPNG
jgi:hypothetical protein